VYLKGYPGYYATGDGARRDADGYYWITGRVDDVVNVSGHRYIRTLHTALYEHQYCVLCP
jgi:acetyl-CoA synthetase